MTKPFSDQRQPPGTPGRFSIYYGWVIVVLAALAMVGTLPGRTQGLGLITEPLLADLQLDRVEFAQMNLWATLLGSLFCLGIGRGTDQWGARVVLAGVVFALGGTVIAMSSTHRSEVLFLLLVLSRGFGQSALSVVSLTMVGQWFKRRLSLAMGIFAVILSVGFMGAFPIVGSAVLTHGWRDVWMVIGLCLLLVLAPLGLLLARRAPDSAEFGPENVPAPETVAGRPDFTWAAAVRTPAFWVFALASSLYNLIASGIGLFNQSILAERGFDPGVYHRCLVITALTSLAGNFLGGWLAPRWRVNRLMALAMALLAVALLGLPALKTAAHVDVFAVVMGLSGGFVIVIFFSFWASAFGRAQLGRIQGTAQMMTVVSSALGPLLLAQGHAWSGSYTAVFQGLAVVVGLLGVAAWCVRLPNR